MKLLFSASIVLCLSISVTGNYLAHKVNATPPLVLAAAAPSHAAFDKLLKQHVDNAGMVDYKGFAKDKAALKTYLDLLSKNPPATNWSKEEKLAYWINAYNAYTIQLVLDHYPVKSIKDIGAKIKIPLVNSPWDVKFIKIGGDTYDLNNIEHGIIRKQFTDWPGWPRIHFALVCAAKSCPSLRNEAYEAKRLDAQLNEQAVDFMNSPTKNAITPKNASLSKVLDWYGDDFKKEGVSLKDLVNKYSKAKITDATRISYQTYDWALNEQ